MPINMNSKERRLFRSELYDIQDGLCAICGGSMTVEDPLAPTYATFEHVRPFSRGGRRTANVVLTHRFCNEARGNNAPTKGLLKMLSRVNDAAEQPTYPRVPLPC